MTSLFSSDFFASGLLWRLRVISFYIIISLVILFFFVFLCIPIFILKPGYETRFKTGVLFSNIYVHLLWVICGIKYEIEGLELLPKDEPYIAAPNHQSFWENFAMQMIVRKHSLIIKKELLNIPVLGWGFRAGKPIAVDRGFSMSVKQIIEKGKERIDQGLSLVIFPEGTRVKPGRNVPLKPSAAKLATLCNVPVAIIVLNSGHFWPKGFWIIKPGTVKVKVVEVISKEKVASFEDARALNTYMQEVMHREKEML